MATRHQTDGTRRKSLTTMMAALLAGSLAATAGGVAFAKTDGQAFDPAKFQQRIEKRVDKALTGTDATADQKKKVTDDPAGRLQGHEGRCTTSASRTARRWRRRCRRRPSTRRRSSRSAPSR